MHALLVELGATDGSRATPRQVDPVCSPQACADNPLLSSSTNANPRDAVRASPLCTPMMPSGSTFTLQLVHCIVTSFHEHPLSQCAAQPVGECSSNSEKCSSGPEHADKAPPDSSPNSGIMKEQAGQKRQHGLTRTRPGTNTDKTKMKLNKRLCS